MISVADYFQLHGSKPNPELTSEIRENARILIAKVNALLEEAGADGVVPGIDQISGTPCASGWRSSGVNARTANAGAKSKHMTGHGIDVQDTAGKRGLAVWCVKNQDVLRRLGLYCEDFRWTAGKTRGDPWVHFQDQAPGSGRIIFIPYRDIIANPPTDPDFYKRNGLVTP